MTDHLLQQGTNSLVCLPCYKKGAHEIKKKSQGNETVPSASLYVDLKAIFSIFLVVQLMYVNNFLNILITREQTKLFFKFMLFIVSLSQLVSRQITQYNTIDKMGYLVSNTIGLGL